MVDAAGTAHAGSASESQLHRVISWKDAFWVASGVPALVLFSIGGIAATVGTPSVLVWTLSVIFGFLQAFTYAEIAGLFPNKSGGASVYGAAAWVRYSKFIAPLSVWCNWLAWTPVLAIGCGIAAGYILNGLFAPDAAIRTWEIQLLDLGFMKEGLKLRLNSTFFIGAILILISFAIQHRGILSTAKVQTIVGVAVLLPLLIIGIVPLITGDVAMQAFQPFAPGTDPATAAWNKAGWTLFFGGLFIAAWSAYAFETAICYTSEFRNPGTDTYKAILYSGLLCIAVYILVPLSFQGALGLAGVMAPGIVDGSWCRAGDGQYGRRRTIGAGADVWGKGTLTSGIVAIALIIPVFIFRHFIQDKGVFPADMLADLTADGRVLGERQGRDAALHHVSGRSAHRRDWLPYLLDVGTTWRARPGQSPAFFWT